MLFYLSSVEEGGETTFPVADNRTFEEQVSGLNPNINKSALRDVPMKSCEEADADEK